ncbi:MAG: hypothetical protein AAF492_08305, partial [Verrucomicrobiota bacterium]
MNKTSNRADRKAAVLFWAAYLLLGGGLVSAPAQSSLVLFDFTQANTGDTQETNALVQMGTNFGVAVSRLTETNSQPAFLGGGTGIDTGLVFDLVNDNRAIVSNLAHNTTYVTTDPPPGAAGAGASGGNALVLNRWPAGGLNTLGEAKANDYFLEFDLSSGTNPSVLTEFSAFMKLNTENKDLERCPDTLTL